MNCQVCKANAATIHLREIKDNLVAEVHLCQTCFQQRSASEAGADTTAPALNLATSLDHASDFQARREAHERSDLTCPDCGMAFRDFLEIGRLGCATCYQAFGEELRPFLMKIHGATVHAGKAPQEETKSLDLRTKLSKLQTDLDQAIETEEYERAASLRDQIQHFEREAAEECPDA